MALRYRIASPICVGVPGVALVGMALDFPNPPYVYLAALHLLANAASYAGSRIPRCAWPKWGMLAVSLLFWMVWCVKVRAGETSGYDLALTWFFPILMAFSLLYMGLSVWPLLRQQ